MFVYRHLKTLNFKDGPSPSFNNCHNAKDTSTLCNGLFADADFYDFFLFSFFLLTRLICHQVKTQCIWVNKDCLATTADQLSYYFFQLCFICLHFDTLCVSSVAGPDWPRQEKDEQADVLGALQPVSGGAALLGPQTSSL